MAIDDRTNATACVIKPAESEEQLPARRWLNDDDLNIKPLLDASYFNDEPDSEEASEFRVNRWFALEDAISRVTVKMSEEKVHSPALTDELSRLTDLRFEDYFTFQQYASAVVQRIAADNYAAGLAAGEAQRAETPVLSSTETLAGIAMSDHDCPGCHH